MDNDGYDKNGFSSQGIDRRHFRRDGTNTYTNKKFDLKGYDINGYDSEGFDINGVNRLGYSKEEIEIECQRTEDYMRYRYLNVDLPPLFITTCSDDFLEADNLALATALSRKSADFELFDPKTGRHEALGHVFVIGMPWLTASVDCLERIRDFSYDRC